MNTCKTAAVAFALLIVVSSCAASQTLTEAYSAFSAHDITRALELFEAVCADSSNEAEDRARAAHGAAVLHWRYYQRHAQGREILQNALALGSETSEIMAALARLEEDAGSYAECLEAASRACLLAESQFDAVNARKAFAAAIVSSHADAATSISPAIPDAVRGKLPLTHDILRMLVTTEPGDLRSSRLLLMSGILLGDGASALAGWQSYFRVADGVSAGETIDDANTALTEHLAEWNGKAANVDQSIAIARALGASRMYGPALLLIALYIPEDQRPQDIIDVYNYGLLTRKAADLADEYYRMTAIGNGDYQALYSSLLTKIKETWENGSWADESFPIQPPFTPGNVSSQRDKIAMVREKFLERFGAYISLARTAGYDDLHYGHAVVDDKRTIEQYGRHAEVRFLLLDSMVSNGFQSWAWDYRSEHGGWANKTGIFQVRPAYADGPVQTWHMLNDPKRLEEQLERMERDQAEDQKRAKENNIVFLPGVRRQLRYEAHQQLLNSLKAKGLSSSELQKRFVAELTRITQEYSIFAHEGRHFIDKQEGVTGGEELEFRAKLSEIAFAEAPKMALAGAVFSSTLGSKTPHGQANERVMRGIVDWMKENAEKIADLDKDTPMLLQLNLLSDEQLREAVRSMDPLAKNN